MKEHDMGKRIHNRGLKVTPPKKEKGRKQEKSQAGDIVIRIFIPDKMDKAMGKFITAIIRLARKFFR